RSTAICAAPARSSGSPGRLAPPVLRPARGPPHRRGFVLVPEVDAPFRQIVGRQLEADPVPRENGDSMLPHLARHVGDHHVAVLQRYAVARIGKHLVDGAFHFDQRFFCHANTPSGSGSCRERSLARREAPYPASPRTDACEASNYPWEKPEAASKGHRGLTQIEFDVANMRVTGVVDKGMAKILLSIQAPALRNARIGSTTIHSRRS